MFVTLSENRWSHVQHQLHFLWIAERKFLGETIHRKQRERNDSDSGQKTARGSTQAVDLRLNCINFQDQHSVDKDFLLMLFPTLQATCQP